MFQIERRNESLTLSTLIERHECQCLNLNPPYQRGYVWTQDLKSELILSIIEDYPIGNVILHKKNIDILEYTDKNMSLEYMYDVVDGQQRLKSFIGFCKNTNWGNSKSSNNELTHTVSREIIAKYYEMFERSIELENDKNIKREMLKLLKNYNEENYSKLKLRYETLPPQLKRRLKAYAIQVCEISCATDVEIRMYFKRVQNQESLKAGEIINSIPDSNIRDFATTIKETELIEKVLGFKDKNDEILKILCSLYGMLDDDSVKFGETDKKLMNYLNMQKVDLNPIVKCKLEKITKILFKMQEENIYCNFTKKFQIKLTLLLIAEGKIDSLKKDIPLFDIFKALNIIFGKVTKMKSDNCDEEFLGYAEEYKKMYKDIEEISQRAHSSSKVNSVLDKTCELIRYEYSIIQVNRKNETNSLLKNEQEKALLQMLKNDYDNPELIGKRQSFTVEDKKIILSKTDYKCYMCGKSLTVFDTEIDHVVPISKGGYSSEENYKAICPNCNKIKGNKLY